jgi:hypothetical protein
MEGTKVVFESAGQEMGQSSSHPRSIPLSFVDKFHRQKLDMEVSKSRTLLPTPLPAAGLRLLSIVTQLCEFNALFECPINKLNGCFYQLKISIY